MTRLAVIILAKNEEKRIGGTLTAAAAISDHVLVIDAGSTDKTVEIAKSAGAEVVYREWDNDFAAQRNFALTQTAAEWVLYLDADEVPDVLLAESIRTALKSGLSAQYEFTRMSYAFGRKFKYGVLRPDRVTRLFPREEVRWIGKVHEHPECKLPVQRLPGILLHFTYESWEQYFAKFNSYTSLWAENAYDNGKRTTMFKAYTHACYAFFQVAFLKFGILDGWLGFILCCNHFSYTLMKYVKLFTKQKKEQSHENIS